MKSRNEIILVDDYASYWLCYCYYINSTFSNLSNVQVQNSHSAVHNSFICCFLPVDFLPIWMFLVKFLENSCWSFASYEKTNTQTTPFQNSTNSPFSSHLFLTLLIHDRCFASNKNYQLWKKKPLWINVTKEKVKTFLVLPVMSPQCACPLVWPFGSSGYLTLNMCPCLSWLSPSLCNTSFKYYPGTLGFKDNWSWEFKIHF